MELLKRIDYALKKRDMSRAQLARELGLSPQAISSLGRRENARLKHENIIRAAEVLHCDLLWLSTGQGEYRATTQSGMLPTGREPAPPVGEWTDEDPWGTRAKERPADNTRCSLMLNMFRLLPEDKKMQAISYVAGLVAKMGEPPQT